MAVTVGVLLIGAVLRFVIQSPLWLDEALSVNIARLALGDIPDALRQDGHPPLYYVLLHMWIALFGEGDVAVRSLSGLWGLALVPLLWIAGRRMGGTKVAWCAVALVAVSPYALRYSTETRMYAMVMVLVLVGWLLIDDALRGPRRHRLAAIAIVAAALLWTHYWAMWLITVVTLALAFQALLARRRGELDAVRARLLVIGSFVAGAVLFVPWLPTLLYQGTRTGTPWARPLRPTEMITTTVADLGGGAQAEAILLGWIVAILVLVGAFGRPGVDGGVEFRLPIHPRTRPFAVAVVGTLAFACVVGYATGATYATRYAAAFIPFFLLVAALGLSRLPRPVDALVLLAIFGLGLVGAYRNVTLDRSDADRSADAIEARAEDGDLVVFCPDQLGPSTSRLLDDRFEQVTYPRFAPPELVDWVDYKERLEEASPVAFAEELLARAEGRQIFLVYSTSYITHTDTCPEVFNALGAVRPPEVLTETEPVWEPSAVVLFAPPAT